MENYHQKPPMNPALNETIDLPLQEMLANKSIEFRTTGKMKSNDTVPNGSLTKSEHTYAAYVNARQVQDTLDKFVQARKLTWSSKIIRLDAQDVVVKDAKGERVESMIFCIAAITISDGYYTRTVEDLGDPNKAAPLKSAVSDSIKRAAVQLGVGRILYELPTISVWSDNEWAPFMSPELHNALTAVIELFDKKKITSVDHVHVYQKEKYGWAIAQKHYGQFKDIWEDEKAAKKAKGTVKQEKQQEKQEPKSDEAVSIKPATLNEPLKTAADVERTLPEKLLPRLSVEAFMQLPELKAFAYKKEEKAWELVEAIKMGGQAVKWASIKERLLTITDGCRYLSANGNFTNTFVIYYDKAGVAKYRLLLPSSAVKSEGFTHFKEVK